MRKLGILIRLGRLVRANVAGEKGAVATLVAVLFGGGVVLGMAAMSIDVGSVLWERRQVQNAADASAMALAQTCAESPTRCTATDPTTQSTLTALNNVNNYKDDAGGFNMDDYAAGLCGHALSSPANLTDCNGNAPNLSDCPPVPSGLDAAIPYVEVHTQTKQANGSSILPTWLIQTLTGQTQEEAGHTVKACARAAWGAAAPSSLNVFPIVMSYCDWAHDTGYTGAPNSATYPSGPDYSINANGYGTTSGAPNSWSAITEQKVFTKGNDSTCTTWNGHSAPGNFYSIADTDCSSNQVLGGWVQATTGNAAPCSGIGLFNGQVIFIPVFDCLQGGPTTITSTTDCLGKTGPNKATGSNTYYHIMGYAAFYVTGWYFSSTAQPSIKTLATPCSGGDRCLSGWFLRDLISEGDLLAPDPGGPPNLGLTVVKPIG
jgi:hypothetical protein